MPDQPPPSWTPIEEEHLRRVDFVAEVLRRSAVIKPADTPKPRWQRFLESTGGAALITVIIGGMIGGYITYLFQSWQKDRDTQQAILKTRTEQALLSYQEYLNKRQEVNKNAYEMLATTISTSDKLMDAFTKSEFDPQNRTGASRDEAEKIRANIKKAYEDAKDKWDNQSELTGFLLAQYHDSNPDVKSKWDVLKTSIDSYIHCAEGCFRGGQSGCGCREEAKRQVKDNMSGFQTAVARSRDSFWKQNLCSANVNAPCQP